MRVVVERNCLEIESDTQHVLGKENKNLTYISPEREAEISGVYVRGINTGSYLRVCNMTYIKQANMAKRGWSPCTTKLDLESKTEL